MVLPWFCHGFAMFCHGFAMFSICQSESSSMRIRDRMTPPIFPAGSVEQRATGSGSVSPGCQTEITNELWPRPPTLLRGKLIDEGIYPDHECSKDMQRHFWTIINIIWNILIHIDVLKSFTKLHNKPTINQQTSGTRQRFGGATDRRKNRVRSWWIGSPICCQSCLENLDMRAGAVEAKIQ